MKKLLLSFAVIAASGAYVAAQDHLLNLPAMSGNSANAAPLPSGFANPAPAKASVPSTPAPGPTSAIAAPAPVSTPESAPASDTSMSALNSQPDAAPSVEVAEVAPTQLASTSAPALDVVPQPLPPPVREVATPAPQQVAQTARQGAYRDGSYKGPSADAYYGRVQVDALIKGGRLSSVRVLQYPNDRARSRRLSNYALPQLEQEVIQAQSANVDTVSGATLTSQAYIRSLGAALRSAR